MAVQIQSALDSYPASQMIVDTCDLPDYLHKYCCCVDQYKCLHVRLVSRSLHMNTEHGLEYH